MKTIILDRTKIGIIGDRMLAIDKEQADFNERIRLEGEALSKKHSEETEKLWEEIRRIAGIDPDRRGIEIDMEYFKEHGLAFVKVLDDNCQCPLCRVRRGEDLFDSEEIVH